MILEGVDRVHCCGCGACAVSCPKSCVSLKADECGFLQPGVDDRLCVGCGLCDKVCPVLAGPRADEVLKTCWAKSTDEKLLASSSSGGVFGLLAKGVLLSGGVVFGAAFADGCRRVEHVAVEHVDGLDRVMRSKYLQSEVGAGVYKDVASRLGRGQAVLFSGAACQVAALRNYLDLVKADASSLLCIDVMCHGVPSPKLWDSWVDHLVTSLGSEINRVNFRSKSTGWLTYSVSYGNETEKVKSGPFNADWYMKAFLANASLRPSCFNCPAKRSCGSDLTLGDYWGVQDVHPEVDHSAGVSAVVANSEKGLAALVSLGDSLEWGSTDFESVLRGNPSLAASVKPFGSYGRFMEDVANGVDIVTMKRRWTFKASTIVRARAWFGCIKRKVSVLLQLEPMLSTRRKD